VHNYFLIEHNYSQYVIYNFKSEIKFWENYNVVKIINLMIIISGTIIFIYLFKNSLIKHR